MIYSISRLRKAHAGRRVLDIERLEVRQGTVHALLGPNGAGKTTLLNILAFLEAPDGGRILFQGEPVVFAEKKLQPLRRRVVLTTQHPVFFSTTVEKNLLFGLKVRGIPRARHRAIVEEALELVGMGAFLKARAHRLSGGESQRLSLARALCLAPEVLLCDEPLAGVDTEHQFTMIDLLRRINAEKQVTVLFTTHDRFQAGLLGGEALYLDQGRLVPADRENTFDVVRQPDRGRVRLTLRRGVSLLLDAGWAQEGEGRIFIDPQGLELFPADGLAPGENRFIGRVVQAGEKGGRIRLVIDIGVWISALLRREDYLALSPLVGDRLGLHVPPRAVRSLPDRR